MGILELRDNKIVERTISKRQYEEIKDNLIKVPLDTNLNQISSNYSWIYVYKGELKF